MADDSSLYNVAPTLALLRYVGRKPFSEVKDQSKESVSLETKIGEKSQGTQTDRLTPHLAYRATQSLLRYVASNRVLAPKQEANLEIVVDGNETNTSDKEEKHMPEKDISYSQPYNVTDKKSSLPQLKPRKKRVRRLNSFIGESNDLERRPRTRNSDRDNKTANRPQSHSYTQTKLQEKEYQETKKNTNKYVQRSGEKDIPYIGYEKHQGNLDDVIAAIDSRKLVDKLGDQALRYFSQRPKFGVANVLNTMQNISTQDTHTGRLPSEQVIQLSEIIQGEATSALLVRGHAFSFAKAYVDELFSQVSSSSEGTIIWPFGDFQVFPIGDEKDSEEDRAVIAQKRFLESYTSLQGGSTEDDISLLFDENPEVFRAYQGVIGRHFTESYRRVMIDRNADESREIDPGYDNHFLPHWKIAFKQLFHWYDVHKRSNGGKKSFFANKKLSKADRLFLTYSSEPITADAGTSLGRVLQEAPDVRRAIFLGHCASQFLAQQATGILVYKHDNFSRIFSRKFEGLGVPTEDLIQEANVGLYKATHRYDHERGILFPTYARWWMRAMISREIQRNRAVRVPSNVLEEIFKLQFVRNKHLNDRGEHLEDDVLANQLARQDAVEKYKSTNHPKYPSYLKQRTNRLKEILRIWTSTNSARSLDASYEREDSSGNARTLSHFIGQGGEDEMIDATQRRNDLSQIGEGINILDEREKYIIELRYGLIDPSELPPKRIVNRDTPRLEAKELQSQIAKDQLTLKDIGKRLGIGRERVRQIEAIALGKIRSTIST